MLDTNLLPSYIPTLLWISALIFAVLTVYSVRRFLRYHTEIKELVDRCVKCQAEVINPTILSGTYTEGNLRQSSRILAGFQNVSNLPFEYACTEVRFDVSGEIIQTMILRQTSMKNPKQGELITIYYDPLEPKQAFAKDMKGILLHKPLRDCFIYGAVAIISLSSALLLQLV